MKQMVKTCLVCGGELPEAIVGKLATPIAELGLSTRTENCLIRGGIKYVEQLVKLGENDLLRLRNMGKVSLAQINEKVKTLGFRCFDWQ